MAWGGLGVMCFCEWGAKNYEKSGFLSKSCNTKILGQTIRGMNILVHGGKKNTKKLSELSTNKSRFC